MAEVTTCIDASPDEVFAVLSDGWKYTNWVVGASHMRAVDAEWPAVGARLHHSSGLWPMLTRDETVVERSEPASRIELLAKGGPLGAARVVITLAPIDGRTRVTMAETPVSGVGRWLYNRLTDAALAMRNTESLARLAALAERRVSPR